MVGTTALLVSAAIAAAGSTSAAAISSHQQSNAAKEAARIQSGAGNLAARDTRESTGRALDYLNAARNAPAPMSAFPGYNNLMGGARRPPMTMAAPGPGAGPGMPGPGAGMPGAPGVPGGQPLPTGYQALFGTGGGYGAQQNGGLVTLRAPDGSTKQVTEEEAKNYPWATRVN